MASNIIETMEASVAVIHSSSPPEDGELLSKILPSRFELDSEHTPATVSLHAGQPYSCTIIVLPVGSQRETSSTVSSYATICLNNNTEVLETAERAVAEGIPVDETNISQHRLAKFVSAGGCSITLTTSAVWSQPENRSMVIEFMTNNDPEKQSNGNNRRFVVLSTNEQTSGSASSERSSSMRRTLSLPSMVPPVVTTRDISSQNRIFPTLRTRVLSMDGNFTPFALNSQTPIPVETELFVGQLLLLIRPKDPPQDDPFWHERLFSKKKRRVSIQLQGKLKYQPEGTLMAGMEISNPMNLGLIASGLCNIILKMTKSFNPALHYSFGTADKERAHICFPASTFFERLVVTPPGETPPDIMEELEEDPQSARDRKAYKTKIDWNTTDTYSMSFHSMYIDFPSWSVVKLPVGKDVSLQTFWGDSSASIVLYEVPNNLKEDRHSMATNKYCLSVELQFLGHDAPVFDDRSIDDDGGSEWSEDQLTEVEGLSQTNKGDAGFLPPLDEGVEDDELEFFDTVQSEAMLPESLIIDINLTSTSPHNYVLRIIDEFCPCWIDMYSKRGKYQTVYAFNGKRQTDLTFFRTAKMVEEAFGGPNLVEVDDRFSHRISSEERIRRILGLKYAAAHVETGKVHKLHRFEKGLTSFDKRFLSSKDRNPKRIPGTLSGFVARALSDRHWIEERVVLQDEEIVFHHMERSKIHYRISISSIINVSIPEGDDAPQLPSFFYLQIETFGRVTYLMFSSKESRDSWMTTVNGLPKATHRTSRSFTNHLFEVDDPMEEFLHKSTMWDCQKRRILNCRKLSFRTKCAISPKETLGLAEEALAKVMALQPKGPDDSDLCDFLDCVAALKVADAYSLNEQERLAFFLNVYHVFIMHAYIVLSPPDSSLKWINYFNTIAFQVSDDIFSLAELEHNVIRAEMSNPSQFLSRFVLPKSYYLFALTKADFRINFALNPGSLSMPTSRVPLYKPERLNEQLDIVTRDFVALTVSIKQKGTKDVNITLPRVCQWFEKDFGSGQSASDVLVTLLPFLSQEKKDALQTIWNSKKNSYDIGVFSLKYLPYNYECRFLTFEKEEVKEDEGTTIH
ncbi:DUF547 domain containing protein [Nitzschia inconspicua]|uniref:DUF547 domain containing protein n=1 Tax=Nitzschia inconspicua TaxID=303405 RepID=A0A9K3LFG8_9STRA|nr:DUF547 domain containing protein [Nitzschia inconspicua]